MDLNILAAVPCSALVGVRVSAAAASRKTPRHSRQRSNPIFPADSETMSPPHLGHFMKCFCRSCSACALSASRCLRRMISDSRSWKYSSSLRLGLSFIPAFLTPRVIRHLAV